MHETGLHSRSIHPQMSLRLRWRTHGVDQERKVLLKNEKDSACGRSIHIKYRRMLEKQQAESLAQYVNVSTGRYALGGKEDRGLGTGDIRSHTMSSMPYL